MPQYLDDIGPQLVRLLLHYDPATGLFRWRARRRGQRGGERIAGSPSDNGRLIIQLEGRKYYAARLAFLYMTGKWPNGEIDHCDCDPGNNRWENLREATHSQNQGNTRLNSKNTSGFKGVYVERRSGKFRAKVAKYHIGTFDTAEQAGAAYGAAAEVYYGEFARVT